MIRHCLRVIGIIAACIPLLLAPGPVAAGGGCGGEGQFCCPGDSCSAGLECVPAMSGGSICVGCGGAGEPCCDDQCDTAGLACVGGVCGDCGATGLGCCDGSPSCAENFICTGADCVQCGQEAGQPCCDEGSENPCREGLTCGGAQCEACGSIGLQCCDNDTCPDEGTCINGTCQSDAAPAVVGAPMIHGPGLAVMAMLIAAIGVFGLRHRRAASH